MFLIKACKRVHIIRLMDIYGYIWLSIAKIAKTGYKYLKINKLAKMTNMALLCTNIIINISQNLENLAKLCKFYKTSKNFEKC